jgi:hypothetical protein
MSEVAVTLFAKAKDDLEAAMLLLPIHTQHDNAGAHLSKACEKFGKAYLELSGIQSYPTTGKHGHDLELIFRMLKDTDFKITKYESLLKLQLYDSKAGYNYVDEDAQLNLKNYASLVGELKIDVLEKIKNRKKKS